MSVAPVASPNLLERLLQREWACWVQRVVPGAHSLLVLRLLDGSLPPGAERRALERQVSGRCRDELRGALGETSLASITHSGGWVIGAGLAAEAASEGPRVLGVGVDCEWESRLDALRSTQAQLRARVVSPEEEAACGKALDFLDFWVLKEAAFKANPWNAKTLLPSYRVSEWDPALGQGEIRGPLGDGGRQVRYVACVRSAPGALRVGFAIALAGEPFV